METDLHRWKNQLIQLTDELNKPSNITIREDSKSLIKRIYIDISNRAIERIDVAGGQGNALAQSSRPRGVLVDQFDTVYVADCDNNRVMRWSKDTKQGTVPVSGNNQEEQLNQFYFPQDLSFDRHSNLYIVDYVNARIQRFNIGSSSS
ncbi:unnamed protein product [Rotaria sp. Silwood1]|nr:unnamed protein product [Rotaria sp. Silwood1]